MDAGAAGPEPQGQSPGARGQSWSERQSAEPLGVVFAVLLITLNAVLLWLVLTGA